MGYIRPQARKGGTVYQAVVNIRVDENGKRIRNCKTFPLGTTKREAERLLREMEVAIDNQKYVPNSNITAKDFLREWLGTYNRSKSPTTLNGYRDIIEKYLIPEFGRVKLRDITQHAIQSYYNCLYERSPLSGKPLAAKTVKNISVVLGSALKKAVQLDIIAKNPAQHVDLERCKKYQSDVYDMDELSQLYAALNGTDLECSINICLFMGLRRGELLALTFDKVDFINNTITIDQNTVQVNAQAITKSPKTEASTRKIDAPHFLMALLEREYDNYQRRKFQFGKDFHDTNLIVSQPNGQGFKPDSFTQKFKRFLKKHGLRHLRVHDLRHENATLMLKAGVNPKIMQKRLGHSNYSTTMDIYSHVLAEQERDAVNLLESSMQLIIM